MREFSSYCHGPAIRNGRRSGSGTRIGSRGADQVNIIELGVRHFLQRIGYSAARIDNVT
jgi:hypothetical protein